MKSLDPQGVNFKQNDVKMLRSKALLNELYTLYDERHEQLEESGADPSTSGGPHTEFTYSNKHLLNDAANLIIHHVKRQTGIQKEDKAKIKLLLRQTLPGMFYHPKQELSDDERDDDDEGEWLMAAEMSAESCRILGRILQPCDYDGKSGLSMLG